MYLSFDCWAEPAICNKKPGARSQYLRYRVQGLDYKVPYSMLYAFPHLISQIYNLLYAPCPLPFVLFFKSAIRNPKCLRLAVSLRPRVVCLFPVLFRYALCEHGA